MSLLSPTVCQSGLQHCVSPIYKRIDWDPSALSEEKEFIQGKLLVDVAKAAGVKHFIYSCVLTFPLSSNDAFISRNFFFRTLESWNDPPVESLQR